ncbi:peptidylprolyl isomerase [Paraflavitalea soli]|uniref:Peptidylprolyl isomerase n=1 Tax=Paraflavitalea soli TaxID=2315862 RepID=A0A3B7MYV4_9BACT|nr:peptidylprolyl isomerase [Paraflavitalea soli]AXY76925.1 peptidylprolyl isomerase [Paraflavitalea soli]
MKQLLTVFAALLLVTAAFAQAPRKVVADKIVGIVGDKIILRSDVYNEILDRQRRQEAIPDNAECYILEQILGMKALVLQAEKDSLLVTDDELEALLDNRIRAFIQMYGGKDNLEQIAGRTIYQIKEDFRQSIKEGKMAENMRDKIVGGLKITPQEVKEYWDKIPKDSLLFYESEVEVGEIVIYPKPSRDLEKLVMEELNDFKQQVESGRQKFETLARLYTEDGTKEVGGRMAINRTEKNWDPTFLNNAFRLKEKQVSPVFKSKFGYHIVYMESRSGDDAIVRHIIRIPKITDAEISEAVDRLDTVRAKLIAGTLTFGEAVNKYSDDENSKFTGGMHPPVTIDQLDKEMVEMMGKTNMKVGDFSKPTTFTDERKKQGVRIVYLKSRTQPHRENLKDDYDRVATRALEMKKQQALEKWFASKIPSYYLMVDSDFTHCANLSHWYQYAARAVK